MKSTRDKILLIGIGNDGRTDDGLGWEFAQRVEGLFPEIDVVFRYQLQIEDADLISQYDKVIFVDSSVETYDDGFQWKALKPNVMSSFTSHALSPEVILGLCVDIYQCTPESYQLAIKGIEWDLHSGLSPQGKHNLESAWSTCIPTIETFTRVPIEM